MKTNEVKACVIRQLRRLQVLPEPQRRAELAELRRGSCRAAMARQRRNGPSIRR